MLLQPLMETLIVSEVCAHQALPQTSVVRHVIVEELMDDDVVNDVALKSQQLVVEGECPSGRAGSPLPSHWANGEAGYLNVKPNGPLEHSSLQGILLSQGAQLCEPLRRIVNSSSTVRVTFVKSSSSATRANVTS